MRSGDSSGMHDEQVDVRHRVGREASQAIRQVGPRRPAPQVGQGREVGEEVDRAALGHHVAPRRQLDQPLRRDDELSHEGGGSGRLVVIHQLEGVGQLGVPAQGESQVRDERALPAGVGARHDDAHGQSRTRNAQARPRRPPRR